MVLFQQRGKKNECKLSQYLGMFTAVCHLHFDSIAHDDMPRLC